jgi:hypothetical protein
VDYVNSNNEKFVAVTTTYVENPYVKHHGARL